MSFEKAAQLIELATLCAARRTGVTLEEVAVRFGVSHRTAQRMTRQLETTFPDAESFVDAQNRKRWRLPSAALRDLMTLTPDELAALDLAADGLIQTGQAEEAEKLRQLKDKILALVPREKARRLETDHEALLEAQGFLARPGPRPRVTSGITELLSEAIKACRVIEIDYEPRGRATTSRRVQPYGLLAGIRRYLVVKAEGKEDGLPSLRAIDRIRAVRLTADYFTRDDGFDLASFAKRSFGAFQSPEEYGEVVWRFSPEAAETARDFIFHPDQTMETQDDGSLVVRFHAAGHLEMAWHLYMWGVHVDVVSPEPLRLMVAAHRPRWSVMP